MTDKMDDIAWDTKAREGYRKIRDAAVKRKGVRLSAEIVQAMALGIDGEEVEVGYRGNFA